VSDCCSGARTVVDHHRLPQRLGELRAELARREVRAGAGRIRHDQAYRPGGVCSLRRRFDDAGEEDREQSRDAHHGPTPRRRRLPARMNSRRR
jgi:hypothetical protein